MFSAVSSNRHIKTLVFKRALKKRLNNPKGIMMDGKKYDPPASVERKTTTIRTTKTKKKKRKNH